jgi:hypothetical protein
MMGFAALYPSYELAKRIDQQSTPQLVRELDD